MPNSVSNSSSTVASDITFLIGEIVVRTFPGFTRMFELIVEKFLSTSSVLCESVVVVCVVII
jgi:hypothetical protein